jgi:cell division protein FtsW (lipid II flippase)
MINNFISNAPYNSLFIIYLLISCNFLAQLFSCQLQNILRNHMYIKHIVGFLTMLFCIILVDSNIQKENRYLEGFFYAVIFYLWFWITTKTNLYITLNVIILFLIIYLLQLYKNSLNNDQDNEINKEKISNLQIFIAIIAFIVSLIGFIMYYLEKKKEYKDNWNYTNFLIGTIDCKDIEKIK